MSFDLFVRAQTLPRDLPVRLQAELSTLGFSLPVAVERDGDMYRIDVGEWAGGKEPALGLQVWVENIEGGGEDTAASAELAQRLNQCTIELHFSNQYLSGERGVVLMYQCAAACSRLLPGGLYLDPSESGWLLPGAAQEHAGEQASVYERWQRAEAAAISPGQPKQATGAKSATNIPLAVVILAGVLLWGAYKLHKAGWF